MIRHPRDFYGRLTQVSRILSRVAADPPQSVSVVGERRIGKSSLLFHLTHPSVRSRSLSESDGLTVLFMDCQQFRNIHVDDFVRIVIKKVNEAAETGRAGLRATPSSESRESQSVYFQLQNELQALDQANRKLVLLLDEFDAITSNHSFGPEFFSFFRSMANNHSVSYVTSSKIELQRLCHSARISDSPFFNIFTNLRLGPFEPEEAETLIVDPSRHAGLPLARFREEIFNLAGHFPLFLQIACSVFFEEVSDTPDLPVNLDVLRSRFREEAAPHFEYIWDQADVETKSVFRRVLFGGQPLAGETQVCRGLVRSGYLREGERDFEFFSQAFSEHLESRLTGDPTTGRDISGDPSNAGHLTGGTINQYELVRRAGEGGMGVVFEAEDTSLHRRVALKFIQPQLSQRESSRRRFLQEARAAAALSHPSIASVFELFDWDDQIVLVMEWIPGRSLSELIEEMGPVQWRQMTEWMIQVSSGLDIAHRNGIVHRDIKSSNLMIGVDSDIKITDFGLAKGGSTRQGQPSDSLTHDGAFLGTLDYVSPEQTRSEPVDGRSDIFSLGVVFFEGLTGRRPFHRGNSAATLKALLTDPAPHLGLYGVENPDRVDAVVRKMLEKSPENRYQNCTELGSALDNLLKKRMFRGWLGRDA